MERLIISTEKSSGNISIIRKRENNDIHPLMVATIEAVTGQPVKIARYEHVASFPPGRDLFAMAAADAIGRVYNLPISWE